MDACVGNLMINEQKKHFRNALQNRGVVPCHKYIEYGSFFSGSGSYIKHSKLLSYISCHKYFKTKVYLVAESILSIMSKFIL